MDREITAFLIRAKRATYAGKGAETSPSRTGSHDLVWQEGDLTYYDTYLGGREFAGEEALWKDGVPFWSMNYIGRVTGEPFSAFATVSAAFSISFRCSLSMPSGALPSAATQR